jgi:hypothetical protein
VADTCEYSSELVMPVSAANFSTSWATVGLSRTLLHIVSYFWEKIILVWVDQVDLWHLPWWIIFTTFEKVTAWIKQWSTVCDVLICTHFLASTWKWTQNLTLCLNDHASLTSKWRWDQLDATSSDLLAISYSSTCFGRLYAHRQEGRLRVTAYGFLSWL